MRCLLFQRQGRAGRKVRPSLPAIFGGFFFWLGLMREAPWTDVSHEAKLPRKALIFW